MKTGPSQDQDLTTHGEGLTEQPPDPLVDEHALPLADSHAVPSLRERLVPPMPGSPVIGWLGPLFVAVFAAVLRFDRLGRPHAVVFDETYYAKDALALLRFGVEHATVKDADKRLLAGNTNIWTDGGSFVVHPPLGKWMIAFGEWLFGATPFGWRFSAALVGSLSVLVLARIARRMTRSTLLGCLAGLLLALDGLHFVQSRFALLDIFVMFWIVAAFGCLVIDRDQSRSRLADWVENAERPGPMGPFLGHPWRVAAAACLGAALASKWSALPFVAAFLLLTMAWDVGARRAAGVRRPYFGSLTLDAPLAYPVILGGTALTYLVSWAGWFLSDIGYHRHWADGRGGGVLGFLPDALRSWLRYQADIWNFHSTLHANHPYQSQPWDWLLLIRPVAYFYSSPKAGSPGCAADTCSRAVLAVGTPAIWVIGLIALVIVAIWYATSRDWRAGAVLLGAVTAWVPWLWGAITDRTMFFFYALPLLPFHALAITLVIGRLIGPADTVSYRRAMGAAIAGAYVLLVIVNFAWLHPVLSAEVIPYREWLARMWPKSWI